MYTVLIQYKLRLEIEMLQRNGKMYLLMLKTPPKIPYST